MREKVFHPRVRYMGIQARANNLLLYLEMYENVRQDKGTGKGKETERT